MAVFLNRVRDIYDAFSAPSQLVEFFSVLCTVNAVVSYGSKRILFGNAYQDNLTIGDILVLPFENSILVIVMLFLGLIVLVGAFVWDFTGRIALTGTFVILTQIVLHGLDLNLKTHSIQFDRRLDMKNVVQLVSPVAVIFIVLISGILKDEKPTPKTLLMVMLLISVISHCTTAFIHGDNTTCDVVELQDGKHFHLDMSLYNGVIVDTSKSKEYYYHPWDKIARVHYPNLDKNLQCPTL